MYSSRNISLPKSVGNRCFYIFYFFLTTIATKLFISMLKLIKFLQSLKILSLSKECKTCKSIMDLGENNSTDRFSWHCPTPYCRFEIPLRKKSRFYNSKLKLQQILILVWCWFTKQPQWHLRQSFSFNY